MKDKMKYNDTGCCADDQGKKHSSDGAHSQGTCQKRLIATIIPYLFERWLILSLEFEWISMFGRIPSFDVMIDHGGRLVIISREACLK